MGKSHKRKLTETNGVDVAHGNSTLAVKKEFDNMELKSVRKKKKKSANAYDDTENQLKSEFLTSEEQEDDISLDLMNNVESNEVVAVESPIDILDSMKPEGLKILFENIEKNLPKNDHSKYLTALEKLDWEKIKFDHYTAEECKSCALNVLKKLRHFRTLSELVVDAYQWIESPWKSMNKTRMVHPDMPKKPLSAFLRFFSEKRPKFQAQYPDHSVTELAKVMAVQFNSLSEKKLKKYRRVYDQEMIEYRERLERFRLEHPDFYKRPSQTKHGNLGPRRPQTPFLLFKQSKMKKMANIDPKEAYDRIRDSWNNLSENKRYKFIRKSLQDEKRYKTELAEFLEKHPNFKIQELKQPLLTKAEIDLKCKFEGRPERPPNSGYILFSQIMLKELTKENVPAKEKMVLIAKRWKEMSDNQRAKYNDDAHSMMTKYILKFDEYIQGLPDDEKERVLGESKLKLPNEKKLRQKMGKAIPSKVENTALIAFQSERLSSLQNSNPEESKAKLMKKINEEWNEMNPVKKGKYIELAESMLDFMPVKKPPVSTPTKTPPVLDEKAEEFFRRTKIKKPRLSAFAYFCQDVLSSACELGTRQRMQHASELWRSMDEDNKQKYQSLARKKFELYNEWFNNFKSRNQLPENDEIEQYNKLSVRNLSDFDFDAKPSLPKLNSTQNNHFESNDKKKTGKSSLKKPSTASLKDFLYSSDSSDESD